MMKIIVTITRYQLQVAIKVTATRYQLALDKDKDVINP